MADGQELEMLQTQLAFLEDTVSSLNTALAAQQREILLLREQLAVLKRRQDELQQREDGPAPAADERPPHY